MLGSALSSVGGASCRKGVRLGFCQDWLAYQKRLSGAIRVMFFQHKKPSMAVWLTKLYRKNSYLIVQGNCTLLYARNRSSFNCAHASDDVENAGADHPMEAHKIDSRAVYAQGQQRDAKEGIDSFLKSALPCIPISLANICRNFIRGGMSRLWLTLIFSYPVGDLSGRCFGIRRLLCCRVFQVCIYR